MKLHHSDESKIEALLLGRTVTKVTEDSLALDDGTVLKIVPNEGCGGCSSGWYDLAELNECPVNAITAVEFDYYEAGPRDHYRIFVLAQDRRILLVDVDGYDGQGWYGSGYWIEVER